MLNINEQNFKLSQVMWARRQFDARNPDDLAEYAYFRQHNRWRDGCPFHLEWPFVNVVEMIKDRIMSEYLEFIQEVAEDVNQ